MDKIYLVRTLDPYDQQWNIECVALTKEDAEEAPKPLAKRGWKTNIIAVKLWKSEVKSDAS